MTAGQRILILGAGGIGGYLGARLMQGGADVTFLVRPSRAAVLARDGLRLVSPLGNAAMPVSILVAGAAPPCDDRTDAAAPFRLVLLAPKAYDLDTALDAVAPFVTTVTGVLPLLNGVAHIDVLRARFGAEGVLAGVAHMAVTLRPDGVVEHLSPLAKVRYGAFGSGHGAALAALDLAFTRARVDATLSAHIGQDLWDKLVFLATLAGMTCLMRASVGDIAATRSGARLVVALLDECCAIAAAAGHRPSDDVMSRHHALLTEPGSTFTASMLRDIERGLPTEADHILLDLRRRADALGVAAPLLDVAATHLEAYERRRHREAGPS